MPAVYIAQMLCSKHHCIVMTAGLCHNADDVFALAESAQKQFEAQQAPAYCEICYSQDLRIETARTIFQTMEEAAPHLEALEKANCLAAAMLRAERD